MSVTPKTIQIFLPDGSPQSIRIAQVTNRMVQAISIPRNKLKDASTREELSGVGLYFLFGKKESSSKPVVYVGEAEGCFTRIKQHNQNKEFWHHAVVIISRTKSFTKSHVKFLEWYCYNKIKEIHCYDLDNTTIPTKSFITESMEADLIENFDSIKILLSTLGFPLLEEIQETDEKELLFCKGKEATAHGKYTADGFVVLKGSEAIVNHTKTTDILVASVRKKLIHTGVWKQEGNVFVFMSDYVFGSPSAAARAILGRRSNGWKEWKNADGKTLDQLKRK